MDASVLPLTVMSAAFAMGAAIPAKYTCGGSDVSPALSWSEAPTGTVSIAVLCHDPDAPVGDWSHWVLFNLDPKTRDLREGIPPDPALPGGAIQGINDFGRSGYGGPCPPPGKPHRYFFKVFALDRKLDLTARAKKADLLQAIRGHVLAEGELMGTFKR